MKEMDAAEAAYERAEEAYLAAIRADADRPALAELASALAVSAAAWNAVAYRVFHAAGESERDNLDWVTERTEVLSDLWADVRDAYRG